MTPAAERGAVVLAIDQGTTATKALLLDSSLRVLGEASEEFRQHFPAAGEVEHDIHDIFESVRKSVRRALDNSGLDGSAIRAIGITNQRETTVLWERATGKPIHRAIVWQDRRTVDLCQKLKVRGLESTIRERTGLLIDPYFSATKISWLLDNVKGARQQAEAGKLLFGTIDTYLTWRLTGGESHVTDVSNASRTLLMDLAEATWSDELLETLAIPAPLLPEIRDNDAVVGETRGLDFLPDGIPIAALLGDQQSALFGQVCFDPGEAKCTYGTGAFLVLNTGDRIVTSRRGLLSTAAWKIGGKLTYALEGSSFIAGAVAQWLRDGLRIVHAIDEVEELAASVATSDGVVFVPALAGIGAPHWDPTARGLIGGLTRKTTAAHIARAALEGVALQIYDILNAMQQDLGQPSVAAKTSIRELKVDGGASRNNLLMQFQADILGCETVRPEITSTTALGAALAAGLTAGVFPSLASIRKIWQEEARFKPRMKKREVAEHIRRWERAVRQARL